MCSLRKGRHGRYGTRTLTCFSLHHKRFTARKWILMVQAVGVIAFLLEGHALSLSADLR